MNAWCLFEQICGICSICRIREKIVRLCRREFRTFFSHFGPKPLCFEFAWSSICAMLFDFKKWWLKLRKSLFLRLSLIILRMWKIDFSLLKISERFRYSRAFLKKNKKIQFGSSKRKNPNNYIKLCDFHPYCFF